MQIDGSRRVGQADFACKAVQIRRSYYSMGRRRSAPGFNREPRAPSLPRRICGALAVAGIGRSLILQPLRSRALDIALATSWPARVPRGRWRNPFLDHWWGKPEDLTSDEETLASYRASTSGGETPLHTVWAGEAIDLIHDVPSAGDIVRDLLRNAEDVLING